MAPAARLQAFLLSGGAFSVARTPRSHLSGYGPNTLSPPLLFFPESDCRRLPDSIPHPREVFFLEPRSFASFAFEISFFTPFSPLKDLLERIVRFVIFQTVSPPHPPFLRDVGSFFARCFSVSTCIRSKSDFLVAVLLSFLNTALLLQSTAYEWDN